jgi:hypothetical protein
MLYCFHSIRSSAWVGVGLAAASCTPQLARVMHPPLTPTQLSTLQPGVPLVISHTTYYPFRKGRVYATGPVRVDRQADGQLRYQRVGPWKQFYANGGLFASYDFSTGKSSQFNPDGTLNHDVYNLKDAYPGDSVQVTRFVRFATGDRQDTLYVQHFYYQNNKYVKDLFTKDFQGKRAIQR